MKIVKQKNTLPEDVVILGNEIQEIQSHIMKEVLKKEDTYLTNFLYEFATPKIKGEITKGKLKWRGIKLVYLHDGLKTFKWIEQRGVQISPKITFDFNLKGL